MFEPKLIKKIKKAGLVGRGCNNFLTAKKWQIVRTARAKEKYVICNISESEPGVFKDRYVLKNYPAQILTGIELAMKTIKADKGFIYLNPEYYEDANPVLQELIKAKGLNIETYEKPLHDYIGGEETAVCNSMEGKRVEPRLKPPYPTTEGFYSSPTLVNNCETFYAVSLIDSGEYEQKRFYCLKTEDGSEHIKELPIDITISQALKEFNHEPSASFFYQVGGGASGNCYNHRQLNRKFSGLASIIIYKADKDEKDVVLGFAKFFKDESCGQCVPCREGTYRVFNLLENHYLGKKPLNQAVFDDLAFSLQNTSLCPLGKVSTNAILTYLTNVKGKKVFSEVGEKCDIK